MNQISVLMTYPMFTNLEKLLEKHYNLIRLWELKDHEQEHFLKANADTIKAVVACAEAGINKKMINLLPRLEIVSTFSVGYDKIDLIKCRERGIKVTNTPDVVTEDVADLAIALALSTLRKICGADGFVRKGLWKMGDFCISTKLSGKSVGIVGLGRIGSAIAKRAEAFNCPVSYYSRSRKLNNDYKYYTNIIDLAANCQILFVACALTEETRYIINREVLDALGREGILINIGRGLHVEESELVSALLDGRLGGAGIDVFENEPDVPDQLFRLDNVVLLPHVGTSTMETCTEMADLVIKNLKAHFKNEPLLTPVL
ncbi:hypothetical protein ACET3Z_016997 [Daucus carota]